MPRCLNYKRRAIGKIGLHSVRYMIRTASGPLVLLLG
jgi:hypothetical protein